MSTLNFTSARAWRDHMNRDEITAVPRMSVFNATMIAEGAEGYEADDQEQWLEAWQVLVDTGICWQLQGFFGRTAQQLIDQGEITAA